MQQSIRAQRGLFSRVSLSENSKNSEKPRNSEEKRMPPIFTLMREFTGLYMTIHCRPGQVQTPMHFFLLVIILRLSKDIKIESLASMKIPLRLKKKSQSWKCLGEDCAIVVSFHFRKFAQLPLVESCVIIIKVSRREASSSWFSLFWPNITVRHVSKIFQFNRKSLR